jgi:hypothetical protein
MSPRHADHSMNGMGVFARAPAAWVNAERITERRIECTGHLGHGRSEVMVMFGAGPLRGRQRRQPCHFDRRRDNGTARKPNGHVFTTCAPTTQQLGERGIEVRRMTK